MTQKIELTEEQEAALGVLKQRWGHVSEPRYLLGEKCVMVEVSSASGGVSMTLGIETDGHCHS